MTTKTIDPIDATTGISGLTVNNLKDVAFPEMLRILTEFVLVHVPEGTIGQEISEARRLDYLLGRIANVHAYLRVLFAQASYLRQRYVKLDADKAEDMLKKKEALHELCEAMKMKYEAVSRMVTVRLETEGVDLNDRVGYDSRTAAAADRSARRQAPANSRTNSWSDV